MDILSRIEATENRYQKCKADIYLVREEIKKGKTGLLLDTPERVDNWVNRHRNIPGYTPQLLERILKGNDLTNINYLDKGQHVAQSVGRINVKSRHGRLLGYGTGFLVASNLLLTNNHVLESVEVARHSDVQFNHQYDINGYLTQSEYFNIRPDILFLTNQALDYTLVAIHAIGRAGTSSSTFGCNQLLEDIGKVLLADHVSIIQHPNGEPKKIAIRENRIVGITENFLHYQTDTSPGSSGSPVYNDEWEVVGLHHSGVPARDQQGRILLNDGTLWHSSADNFRIKWLANEGVRISRIIKDIRESVDLNQGEQLLIQKMLNPSAETNTHLAHEIRKPSNRQPEVRIDKDQIHISVRIPTGLNEQRKEVVKVNTAEGEMAFMQIVRFEFVVNEGIEDVGQLLDDFVKRWKVRPQLMLRNIAGAKIKDLLFECFIETNENPWTVAAEINEMEGMMEVFPDISSKGITEEFSDDDEVDVNEGSLGLFRKKSNKLKKEKKYKKLKPDWNHETTKFKKAIKYAQKNERYEGLKELEIVQLDTGYLNHPEIKLLNIQKGYDFKDMDNDPSDDNQWYPDLGFVEHQGHGTRTASLIIGTQTRVKADHNNGVLPDVSLIPYRVADSVVILRNHQAINKAVVHAMNEGYRIITMSMGGVFSPGWRTLAKVAYDKGVFWICAAGNQVRYVVVWPAAYAGTIAVGATDCDDTPWKASSRGKQVDICAPGHNIYVPTFSGDQPIYSYGSGTSYAAPHVAAAVALWLNYYKNEIQEKYSYPWQTIEAFRTVMKQSAEVPKKWESDKHGAGILNVEALLKAELPDPQFLTYAYGADLQPEIRSLEEQERLFRSFNESGRGDDL